MDTNLKDQFDGIETSCTDDANNSVNESAVIVNNDLNNTMNSYRDEQVSQMETELADYEKQLEEIYKDEPEKIPEELAKKQTELTATKDANIANKLQEEMALSQTKMNTSLSIKMDDTQTQLQSKLANPFGDMGKGLEDTTKGKIGGIESKLGKIEDKLGNKTAKKVVDRATRNGNTSSINYTTDTTSSTISSVPKKIKGMKHQIDDNVKNQAILKINQMKENAAIKLQNKMHSKIYGKMQNKVNRMIGSDIKWLG